jgi:hypothetical protein
MGAFANCGCAAGFWWSCVWVDLGPSALGACPAKPLLRKASFWDLVMATAAAGGVQYTLRDQIRAGRGLCRPNYIER